MSDVSLAHAKRSGVVLCIGALAYFMIVGMSLLEVVRLALVVVVSAPTWSVLGSQLGFIPSFVSRLSYICAWYAKLINFFY